MQHRSAVLEIEKQLMLGGLESTEARMVLAVDSRPRSSCMPVLSLDDLGVKRWQPPEDIATQLDHPAVRQCPSSSCNPSRDRRQPGRDHQPGHPTHGFV